MTGGRNRQVTLKDITCDGIMDEVYPGRDDAEEDVNEESALDLRIGIGGCWLNADRTCDETCMAYNVSQAESGENPCLAIVALRDIADPVLEQRDLKNDELTRIRKTLEDLSRNISVLSQGLQQWIARIR